jgi:hypothetical protein
MDLKEVIMKHRVVILSATAVLAIVSVTGCFSQKSSNSSAHATNTTWTSTRNAVIQDPAYGMAAYTLAVPTGWKYAGMILRPGGCHPPPTPAAGLSYIEQSPDGLTAFVQLPGVSWTWTSNGSNVMGPKCPSNINIDTAAGLLLNIAVPNLHPHAISVVIKPLPQANQDAIKTKNQQLGAQSRSFGRQFQDAARVVVEYELNGVVEEESMLTVIDCTESRSIPMPGGPGRPQIPGFTKRNCSSRGTYITRAPKGHLDEAMKTRVFPQINSQWDNRVIHDMNAAGQQYIAASNAQFKANQQYFAEQNRQMLNRGKQFQANLQDSTNRAMQNDRNNQAAIDHAAHQTALYSLDRQTFINPSTGQKIEASNQYNHQWMSSDGGTLIQTQDHSFDPNGSVYPVSQSWTELVPTN